MSRTGSVRGDASGSGRHLARERRLVAARDRAPRASSLIYRARRPQSRQSSGYGTARCCRAARRATESGPSWPSRRYAGTGRAGHTVRDSLEAERRPSRSQAAFAFQVAGPERFGRRSSREIVGKQDHRRNPDRDPTVTGVAPAPPSSPAKPGATNRLGVDHAAQLALGAGGQRGRKKSRRAGNGSVYTVAGRGSQNGMSVGSKQGNLKARLSWPESRFTGSAASAGPL
jgi:hypothetical protein